MDVHVEPDLFVVLNPEHWRTEVVVVCVCFLRLEEYERVCQCQPQWQRGRDTDVRE